MAQKSFYTVLEDQIRRDLRAEIEAEVRAEYAPAQAASAPRQADKTTEFWHMPPVTPLRLHTKTSRTTYATPKKAERPAAPTAKASTDAAREVRIHPTTPSELLAYEWLQRAAQVEGGETLSLRELKNLWRKAALRTHPDVYAQADAHTQAQAAARFRELTTAYETLEELFALGAKAA